MVYPEKFGGMYDGGEEKIGDGGEEKIGDGGISEFSVPTEYQNEGWAKDLKSYPAVWTKLAGSEKLIGQRDEGKVNLLKENSSSEEIETFYKAIGRPDKADEYKFNREGQSEVFKKYSSDKVDSVVKSIFHKWGLRPDQALGIQKDYEAMMEGQLSEQIEAEQKADTNFEEVTTKAFGNDKDAIIESSKLLLENFTPEGFEDHVKKLDNDTLTILAGVLNGIKKTFISEDEFSNLNKGGGGTEGQTEADLRKKAITLMASKEWTDPFNPKNKEAREEVNAIYKKIGDME